MPFIDVKITASGYKAKLVRLAKGLNKVYLEPGLRVKIVYNGKLPLPKPPYSLTAELVLKCKVNGRIYYSYQEVDLGSDGTGEIVLSEPGTYKVEWKLVRKIGKYNTKTYPLSQGKTKTIEVKDVPGVQAFQCSPDPGSLKETLDEAIKQEGK